MSVTKPSLNQRLRRYIALHRSAARSSVQRVVERPVGSMLTASVLALALALPLSLLLAMRQAEQVSASVRESRELAVFLKPELGEADAARWADRLRTETGVAEVAARSPAHGLEELAAMRELGDALALLDSNPLPWVLVVQPKPGTDDHALAASLRDEAEIDYVQHDAAWRDRLDAWLALAGRLLWVLGAALALGGLLIVGNTVRLDLRSRNEEIAVLRLLGATAAYIRRPFLYLGAAYGALAAGLALAFCWICGRAIEPAARAVAATYGSDFALLRWVWQDVALTFVAACALGVLGAYLAVGHFLRQSEVA